MKLTHGKPVLFVQVYRRLLYILLHGVLGPVPLGYLLGFVLERARQAGPLASLVAMH